MNDLNVQQQTRQLREGFLDNGVAASDVRPEVATSWRRSRLAGVDPDAATTAFEPIVSGANQLLLQSASPVLDWLSEQLTDGMAVVLANAEARVLDRRSGGAAISNRLDELNCSPGFSFAEEYVGTNALGCVPESPGPVTILGSEHYRQVFADMTGMAAPLRHPIHRRLVGMLSVTCRVEDTNELMMPIQLSAVREIQSRMYAAVSMRERELLEEFLKVSKRSATAVVTLNQDFIITNTAASTFLNPADHAVLWQWAADAVPRNGEYTGEVRLSDGEIVRARVRAVGERDRGAAGVVLELRRAAADDLPRSSRPRAAFRDGAPLPGRSVAWQHALAELDAARRADADVLITGEVGVGKFRAAVQVCVDANPNIIDAALAAVEASWFERLQVALSGNAPIVLRHLDLIPDALVPAVGALLEKARDARVLATALSDSATRLTDYFHASVDLPPLRNRPEDIADIAPALLRRTHGRAAARLQPPALHALMAHDWPGNVRELSSALNSARVRAMGGDIALSHLPTGYRQHTPSRTLPGLKRSERDAIVEALSEAAGNKLLAAERLGIARSTLYRKMRALGLDPKRRA